MRSLPERILITGANGHLGRQLIARLCAHDAHEPAPLVRALVRSERAAGQVRGLEVESKPEVVIGDYTCETAMAEAVSDCGAVVHLAGIIKQSRDASYQAAHEDTCEVLAQTAAAASVDRIVYLSILGSRSDSPNPCLASKGKAEDILLGGPVPATIIRVPMVLGPNDFASAALRRQARTGLLMLVGGGATLQQPIDSADVITGILGALRDETKSDEVFEIGGPERLTHRALVARAAALYDRKPIVVPIPLGLVHTLAAILERLLAAPPITRAMLEILQHDDRIDEAMSCARLDIEPTSLDETLRRYVGPESVEHD